MNRPLSLGRLLAAYLTLIAPALAAVLAGLAVALLLRADPWLAAGAGTAAAAALAGLLLTYHQRRIAALVRALDATEPAVSDAARPALPASSALTLDLDRAAEALLRRIDRARRGWEEAAAGNDAVLHALPDPLLLLNAERRIVRANPAAEALFERALAGADFSTVLRSPTLLAAIAGVRGGGDQRLVEFALPGQVARYFAARVARLPAPARDGTEIVVSLHDLTALKRAEQMRADFVANASHELRTPLASVLGFIETLRGPARDDAQARERFLAVMQEQTERMTRLVEDLLSLSRIELHEHTPPRGTADIPAIVSGVAETLMPQARAKQIDVRLDLAEIPPLVAEPDGLAQVFQNLLDNAIKYGRQGSTVRVSLRPAGPGSQGARRLGRPGVAIAFADESEGIAREHLPRLTERFYRVDTARSRALGGTGLGLAIVKHILNRHRGVLDIDSEIGKGSVFTVYLPASEGERHGRAAQ